jgi:RNA polymerase sigma-70 factor (ECF subfamily)
MTDGPTKDAALYALKPTETDAAADLPRLRRRLLGLALKLTWNRDDAEELVQDAFAIALAKGPPTNEHGFVPWMLRTVSNLCLNHRRRRRTEPISESEASAAESHAGAAMERAEALEALRSAVMGLPDQQRLAITLRCLEGMDYASVAEVMQISESAVRAHVHQGRRRLATDLHNDTDEQ